MLPLLTFASGLVAGIVGLRLLKSVKAPENLRSTATARLETIGDKARQATVSGLTAIEKSSAGLRTKLTPVAAEPALEPDAVVEAQAPVQAKPPVKAKPARKPARKKAPPPVAETETETGS